jgi:hypothetical protein
VKSAVLILGVVVAVTVAAVRPPAAYAVYSCWSGSGTHGPYAVASAPSFQNVFWSQWSTNVGDSYLAQRWAPDGSLTYNQSISGGGAHDFANDVDVIRQTKLVSQVARNASWYINQLTQTSC